MTNKQAKSPNDWTPLGPDDNDWECLLNETEEQTKPQSPRHNLLHKRYVQLFGSEENARLETMLGDIIYQEVARQQKTLDEPLSQTFKRLAEEKEKRLYKQEP